MTAHDENTEPTVKRLPELADFIHLPSGDCGEDPGTLSVP